MSRARLALSTLAGLLTLAGFAFAVSPGDEGSTTIRDGAEREPVARVATPAGPPAPPGALLAFGYNSFGQLGLAANSGMTVANPTPTVVALPGQDGVVTEAAVGGPHSLVATSSGQLYSFGYNRFGQLGRAANSGMTTPTPTPALVTLPGQSGIVTEVATGRSHSLVLTSSGQLYSFGHNRFGQLGRVANVTTSNPNPTPALVTLPGQTGTITHIAAGHFHSLVATSSGQVYAFGYNRHGELGNAVGLGTYNAQQAPTLVTLPGQNGAVTELSAGRFHSLALTSGAQLYTWGRDKHGELGRGFVSGGAPFYANPTPAAIALPGQTGNITHVAGGSYHTLAATSGVQLYAFGYDSFGQLGDSIAADTNPHPTPLPASLPGLDGSLTQLAAGSSDSLVVSSSGQLFAFGYNRYGQLGTDTNNATLNPNATPTLVPLTAGTTIVDVADGATANHTLALVAPPVAASGSSGGGAAAASPPAPRGEEQTPQAPSRVVAAKIGISHRFITRTVAGRYQRIRLICPATAARGCAGFAKIRSRFGNSHARFFELAAGKTRTYRLRLSKKLLRYIAANHVERLAARVVVVNTGPGNAVGGERRIKIVAPGA